VTPEEMIHVSIDDHVVEPRDMFVHHIPEKWKSDAPKIVRSDDGMERWVFGQQVAGSMGLKGRSCRRGRCRPRR